MGPEDHALPPDNFQEEPQAVVAHRTSPTNIGMYLLTILTARDFGWIGTVEAIERLEATLATIARLERHRGHLYNWYDTRDLRPLDPPYVSSVDSGNLCAALLVVANACYEMLDRPLPVAAALAGMRDAAGPHATGGRGDGRRAADADAGPAPPRGGARALRGDAPIPRARAAWADMLARLGADARTLADVASALTAERGDAVDGELATWAGSVRRTVESHARDLELLRPAIGCPTRGDRVRVVPDAGRDARHAARRSGRRRVRRRRPSPAASRAISPTAPWSCSTETEFGFLFDPIRKLFSIGYRVADGSLDPSYYDLLASEARLTSFLAIAKGDVPVEHWFRLGRP